MQTTPAKKKRPNILLVISDQQRWDTIGACGRQEAQTPHLDRLVSEGITCNHAFCTTPMCSPTRASILSGLFPHSHGMVANHQARPGCDQMNLSGDVKLLADYLLEYGYKTGYAGKWHLGTGSDRRGFRDFAVRLGDYDVDCPADNDYVQYAKKLGIELPNKQNGIEPEPSQYQQRIYTGPSARTLAEHPSSFVCDLAVDFIRRCTADDQTFCLTFSTHEPHPPFVCPQPFFSLHDPDQIDLPTGWDGKSGHPWTRRPDWQLRIASDYSESDLRKMWAAYLGSVSFVDHLFGRLMTALRDTNTLDDTLVIFTSDHGEMLGSHGLLFKGASLCEELIKVPLIVRFPRSLGKEKICDSLISHADLVPTILETCGFDIPENLEGKSVLKEWAGNNSGSRQGLAAEFHSSNWCEPISPLRMWRTKEFKYIESAQGDNELYDLQNDSGEFHNLYGNKQYQPGLKKMQQAMNAWLRQTGDTFPNVPMPPQTIKPKNAYKNI